ncbi:hypothetical protein BZL29_4929 [Mycobacterium kansasii]|uniref:Uncharacterized protein n=1 Tax=Mycobacterium kansasii TaxID=1768 RepID=A0A1V3X1B3_MYCKA|nr:hypothetical protein BZL29_4929 [Mycobacterium kansasii]
MVGPSRSGSARVPAVHCNGRPARVHNLAVPSGSGARTSVRVTPLISEPHHINEENRRYVSGADRRRVRHQRKRHSTGAQAGAWAPV